MAKKITLALLALLLALSKKAEAAPVNVEIGSFAGYSTEGVQAASSQVRVSGDAAPDLRYFLEGLLSARGGTDSDALATSYPYQHNLGLLESYLEKSLRSGSYRGGVRLGRYRTPFGIYGEGDQAYVGFLRSPLVRSYESRGVSNTWLEGGIDSYFGLPQLQLEVSLGIPQEDSYHRGAGLDSLVRVQGYQGPWIVGYSHITTRPQSAPMAPGGQAAFDGVDFRWMHAGVQMRGEWIQGALSRNARSRGGYIDALVHLPSMDRITAIARYDARTVQYGVGGNSVYGGAARAAGSSVDLTTRRWIVGAKMRIAGSLVGQANLVLGYLPSGPRRAALDFGINYSWRPE